MEMELIIRIKADDRGVLVDSLKELYDLCKKGKDTVSLRSNESKSTSSLEIIDVKELKEVTDNLSFLKTDI